MEAPWIENSQLQWKDMDLFFFFFAISAMTEKVFQKSFPELFPFLQMAQKLEKKTLTQDGVDTYWQLSSEDQNGLFANAANRETEMV